MEFLEKLAQYEKELVFTPRQGQILRQFYHSYIEALKDKGTPVTQSPPITLQFLELIVKQIRTPYHFQVCHKRVTKPDDYFTFGLDIIRPLIDFKHSICLGTEHLALIDLQLKQKHNCIFFANHQTEPDPQAINLLIEKHYPEIGAEMLFVAGDRVISDPIAVPFSKGRNMLCIYSRKHMDYPPEKKMEKQQHNRRALQELVRRLSNGGQCVYVAPSGGRDRPDAQGTVNPAPFDRDAIDLFALMAKDSGIPTHFYPLSLLTHHLLPPPPVVENEIGEDREFHYTPIGLHIGAELDMTYGSDRTDLDKKGQRQLRCEYIYGQVCQGYQRILDKMP